MTICWCLPLSPQGEICGHTNGRTKQTRELANLGAKRDREHGGKLIKERKVPATSEIVQALFQKAKRAERREHFENVPEQKVAKLGDYSSGNHHPQSAGWIAPVK